jgi:hypothetical protein
VDLEALQYDILYGEQYAYEEGTIYEPTDMKLGVSEIVFKDIKQASEEEEDTWYITGEYFTASSKLEINGKMIEDTYFINPSLLMVRDVKLEDKDELRVAQQSNSSTHRRLTHTDPLIYQEPEKPTPTPLLTPAATVLPTVELPLENQ